MEIHAPHKPILTLKEAAAHLVIVTAGILIALSLEGLLERQRHHALVREARANVTIELTGNKARLEKLHGELDGMKRNLERGLDVLNTLPGSRAAEDAAALYRVDTGGVIHNYDIAELRTASRTTAEMTGAFGLMDYAEVQTYASAYDRQALFNRVQDQAWTSAMAAFSLGQKLDFQKASPAAVEDAKRQLRLAIGTLIIEEEVATALIKAYERALTSEGHP
jgi:hypothetical protein